MDDVTLTYPGIGSIIRWKVVVNRGIVPSTFVVETVPQAMTTAAPATLKISLGSRSEEFPDVVAANDDVQQTNRLAGFRTKFRLQDHRWRWKYGIISGIYNVRLPDGTVDPTTRKTPAQLATLLLQAMGEVGFDVVRMPTGMFPPANWDKTNPAEALDALCRYVGCEITGGEKAKVVIWPIGRGAELPTGKYINPTFTLRPQDRPRAIAVVGGNTVFQSRLKLAAVARDDVATLNSFPPYLAQVNQSPFSFPDIATTQQRTDAFQSVYKWFYTATQADGTHVLPGSVTAISKGTQYRLLNILIDTWLNSDAIRLTAIPGVLGKFWPRGDDADECLTMNLYNGHFGIDASRNIVSFPYPIWNLDSIGNIKAPELYLYSAYHVRSLTGEYESFTRQRFIGGASGIRPLYRPEILYAVKHLYNNDNQIANTVTTLAAAEAEAKAYLDVFQRIYSESDQRDVEWASLEKVSLDGRVAQVRYQGGVKEPFLMRASRMSEHDIFGPSAQGQRRDRYLDSMMEKPHVTA